MKTIIRLITLSIVVIFSVSFLMAQSGTKDVVYLKNGSIIKGTILEMVMDQSIKIQTADGSIFVYTMSEVDRISKESAPGSELSLPPAQGNKDASSSFVLYGGGTIPAGDFAKDDNENAGFAKTGWLAGAQFVTGGSIGFLIDASYSSNPSTIDKVFSSEFGMSASAGKWSSILVLAGVKIGTSNPTGVNFFIAPLVGANIMKSPEASANISVSEPQYGDGYYDNFPPYTYHPGYYVYVNINAEATLSSVSKTVVVYGMTMEVILGGGITIGARYLACKPKYDMEVKIVGSATAQGITVPINQTEKIGKWEPNVALAQIYLGIAL